MDEGVKNIPFLQYAKASLGIGELDIRTYSPLTLAYVGDAVFSLLIRTVVVSWGNTAPKKLHKRSSELVKAETQAAMAHLLAEELTEEEMDIYKRGRNAQSFTHAKNASLIDYRCATGLEALFGYLYLTEQFERMIDLTKSGLRKIEEGQ